MLKALRRTFTPNKVVLVRPAGESPDITQIAPFTRAQAPVEGKPTAYVCRNRTCSRPTTDPQEMLDLLTRGQCR
jgi:hypothetical protein